MLHIAKLFLLSAALGLSSLVAAATNPFSTNSDGVTTILDGIELGHTDVNQYIARKLLTCQVVKKAHLYVLEAKCYPKVPYLEHVLLADDSTGAILIIQQDQFDTAASDLLEAYGKPFMLTFWQLPNKDRIVLSHKPLEKNV